MMLPVETLEKLVGLSRESAKSQVVEIPGESRKVLINTGGIVEAHEVPPPLRGHHVDSLADLVEFANWWQSDKDPAPTSTLWHNEGQVVLVLSEDDRRERVTLALETSEQFDALQELSESKRGLQHAELIFTLKHTFHDAGVETLIPQLRRIDFKRRNDGTSEVSKGREAMGKSVEAAVQQIDDLPDFVVLSVPVYRNPGQQQRFNIRCRFDVDAMRELFYLVPYPNEIENAMESAQAVIRHALQETELPAFRGKP